MFYGVGKLISVFVVLIFLSTVRAEETSTMYPEGLHISTTCEEFGRYARFNPYSVLGVTWFVFYYWAPDSPRMEFVFEYPTPKQKIFLHYVLDEHVSVPINWTARFVEMRNILTNDTSLLVEVGDRGQYLLYPVILRQKKDPIIIPIDVRLKQTGDGKYIGFMMCKEDYVYALCKKTEIPKKKDIQDEAARIGYRGRSPKSYLYQGHEWMPIPEDDENTYWMTHEEHQREKEKLNKMIHQEDFIKKSAKFERKMRKMMEVNKMKSKIRQQEINQNYNKIKNLAEQNITDNGNKTDDRIDSSVDRKEDVKFENNNRVEANKNEEYVIVSEKRIERLEGKVEKLSSLEENEKTIDQRETKEKTDESKTTERLKKAEENDNITLEQTRGEDK